MSEQKKTHDQTDEISLMVRNHMKKKKQEKYDSMTDAEKSNNDFKEMADKISKQLGARNPFKGDYINTDNINTNKTELKEFTSSNITSTSKDEKTDEISLMVRNHMKKKKQEKYDSMTDAEKSNNDFKEMADKISKQLGARNPFKGDYINTDNINTNKTELKEFTSSNITSTSKGKIQEKIQHNTADYKFDKKEAQQFADALKSNDPKKIEELIKHVDSKKGINQIPDYKFDKKEAQQFADALKSNDPKKIEELIKHVDSKKGINQIPDYKFDKKEAQQFADALKSKDISKIPNTISKEESKEFLEKVGTEKPSLNKLLAQSGQQLDMETLNNAMEISNIQQNKSSQER